MMWFSSFILLATITSTLHATQHAPQHDLQLDSFWSIKAPDEEALKFFNELDKSNNRKDAVFDFVQVRPRQETAFPRSLKKKRGQKKRNATKAPRVRSSDDGEKIDTALGEITTGLTLHTLTNGLFNGNDFKSDDSSEEDGKIVVTGSLRDSSGSLRIPGGDLKFKAVDDKDTIVVKVSSSEATFEKAYIAMEGEAYFTKLEKYKIPIKIEKKEDSEDFEITEFALASKAIDILTMIGSGAEKLETLFGTDLKSSWINTIKEELGTFSGFGSFSDESLQLVIHLDDNNKLTGLMKAKSVDFLIAQSGAETPRHLSIFVTLEDFINKVGEIIGQADAIKENFLLKNLNSEACLFLVSAQMEYLDPIKSDERLATCFGDQENDKNVEVFKVVDAGFHASVKIDFKDAIAKGCYGSEEDETPPDLENVESEVHVYGKLTKGGLQCHMLTPVKVPTKLIAHCFKGMLQTAPKSLTDGQIEIKEISRYKVEEDNEPKKIHWRLGLKISPSDEYKKIPGTQISLEGFELDAEGDEKDFSSWNIDANLETSIGKESKINLALKKCGNEYFLELTSSKLILSDVLSAFSATATEDTNSKSILDTLGVKDFSLSMKFGSDVPEYEFLINGKPIIFGFDKLEIAAIIVKANPNAPKDDGSEKALANRRSKDDSSSSSGGAALKVTVGLYLNGADFTALMKNVFGREDISLEWLSGLKAVAVFTNDAGNVKLVSSSEEEESGDDNDDDNDDDADSTSTDEKKVTKRNLSLIKKHAKKNTKRRLVSNPGKSEKKSNLIESNITDISYKTLIKRQVDSSGDDDDDDGETEGDDDGDDGRRELKFEDLHETLVDKDIDYTITFAVLWDVPSDASECGGNGLCTWMAENMDGMSLCIMGELGGGVFKLTAAIETKVKLIEDEKQKLTFDGMALKLEVGATTPTIELSATMTYSNEDIAATGDNSLVFKGQLSATVGSLSLTFSMSSFIFPKFGGVSYFAIGNIILGGGVTAGLPNFVFGAALKLGKFDNPPEDTDHAIEIRGAFGIDLGNPKDTWVYGRINALNIEKVCQAFKLNCANVPDDLAKSGFPYGIEASYSSEEREIETVGTIPMGLYVKGTLNVFGAECSTELRVSSEEFYLHIEMSPLDWGNGMIQVSRNKEDKNTGPIAKAAFSYTDAEAFDFHIEGYANVLGVLENSIRIKISKDLFDFEISGYLIPAFLHVRVHVFANYGEAPSGDDALFKFEAEVSAGFSETLKKAVIEFLKNLKKKVEAAFEKAKKALTSAQDKVNNAKETVEGWKKSIRDWKEDLQRRKVELEEEMKPKPCDCPQVCFQFFDWDSNCWKIWGYWVGCPFWNSCFKMIDDIFCLAGCAITKIITTLVKWAKQAILSLGQLIAGGIEGLLTLAQGVLTLAEGILEAAKRVVDLGKRVISGALQLAADIFKELVESFKLNKLLLRASLTADYSACVGYEYDIIFFKKPYSGTGEACLDLKAIIGALIGGMTEQEPQTKGVSKTPERLKEIESESKEVDDADADYQSEKSSTESKVKEDTSQKFEKPESRGHIPTLHQWSRMLEDVPRHAKVPTKEEMKITELATQKVPRYNPKSDPKVHQFTAKSPWKLPQQHLPVGHNETAKYDPNQTGEKRTLNFESHEGACTRMRRAMRGFSDLTDGILKYSQAIQKSKKTMQTSRDADSAKLDRIHDMIQDEPFKRNITMSAQDKEDAYYIYNNLADRHDELDKKSSIAIHTEDSYAMPMIRRQINGLLEREKGTTFMQFTDLMHSNAVEGYKRSQIPSPTIVQGEKMLGDIKTELQSIVTSENSALTPMTSRLENVRRNIIAMSEVTKKCQDS